MGTDLEAYRRSQGLTYRQLCEVLGFRHPSQMRSWAIGEVWPDADVIQTIVEVTAGDVSLRGMHERRLQWLRERDAKQSAEDADDDGRRNRNDDALKCSPAGP